MGLNIPASHTLRHYTLNQVKFRVGPPRRTTEWAKATLGPKATFPEYISRDLNPVHNGEAYSRLQIKHAKVLPPSHLEPNSIRLAVPTDTVTTIAANLDPKVNLAHPLVQDQDLSLVAGHTVFPAWHVWHGLTREEEEYEGEVDVRAADGTPISRDVLGAGAGAGVSATADLKLTLSYRGEVLDPKAWEAAPVSLKWSLRSLWMHD